MLGFLLAVSAALSLVSGFQQHQAQRAAGQAAEQAARFQATLAGRRAEAMEQRAGQERASAQRQAIEQRRQGRLVSSRARAVAAASGGAVTDPTVTGILADIDTEAEYRALTGLFQGEEMARGLEHGAAIERAGGAGEIYAGRVERSLANARANQALLSGVGQAVGTGASYYAYRGSGDGGASDTIAGSQPTTLYSKYGRSYNDQFSQLY